MLIVDLLLSTNAGFGLIDLCRLVKKIHMIGLAAICWAIWRMRNSVFFEDKKCRSPTEIICLASSFILYWSGLQNSDDKMELEVGAEALKPQEHGVALPPTGSPT